MVIYLLFNLKFYKITVITQSLIDVPAALVA